MVAEDGVQMNRGLLIAIANINRAKRNLEDNLGLPHLPPLPHAEEGERLLAELSIPQLEFIKSARIVKRRRRKKQP